MLVVMGGNTSCGTDARGATSPYGMGMYEPFRQLATEVEATGIAVDFVLTCYNSNATVQLVASDDPLTLKSLTREAFQAKLTQFRAAQQPDRVVLAGHSYGGWLAMKTVLEQDQNYESIFTLDPISRETCTFTRPFGCTQAPGDIGDDKRDLIASRTNLWSNFYQTRTGYLHSSEIDHADENLELPLTHVQMDDAPAIWERLATSVAASLL